MSSLFAVIAIVVAGVLGASITGGDSKAKGGLMAIYATAFVAVCALLGYLMDINPAKIMTGCGLAIAALFVGAIFFGKKP